MNWWHYLLLVNIYLVLFYSFYALLLRKETFFSAKPNLPCFGIAVIVYHPGYTGRLGKKFIYYRRGALQHYGQAATINLYALHPLQSSPITVGAVLLFLYIAGITVLSVRFALQLIRVSKILKAPEPSAAFAFFNK